MAMTAFVSRFPEIAAHETRVLTVRGRADLPDGEYAFVELYPLRSLLGFGLPFPPLEGP
jgi:hypothetical protein